MCMHTEKSKKNYREFRTGNLKFELFNLISSPKKNVRKSEDGMLGIILWAVCSTYYYAEYNMSKAFYFILS